MQKMAFGFFGLLKDAFNSSHPTHLWKYTMCPWQWHASFIDAAMWPRSSAEPEQTRPPPSRLWKLSLSRAGPDRALPPQQQLLLLRLQSLRWDIRGWVGTGRQYRICNLNAKVLNWMKQGICAWPRKDSQTIELSTLLPVRTDSDPGHTSSLA